MILERNLLRNNEEYLEMIRFWFGKEWTDDPQSWKELELIHGVPKEYPALVAISYNPESTYRGYQVTILDPTNIIIPRPKSAIVDDL